MGYSARYGCCYVDVLERKRHHSFAFDSKNATSVGRSLARSGGRGGERASERSVRLPGERERGG